MNKKRTLFIFVLAVLGFAKGLFASTAEPNLHLAVVLDSSPASNKEWDLIKGQLLEAVHALKSGDALDVLIARPGEPKILVSTRITESHSLQRDQVTALVSGLPKQLLFGADFGKALQTANDRLQSRGPGRRQCLIILTHGRREDRQIERIRKWARTFQSNNWPVCITCDQRRANRDLLTAASQKEFDVRFLDRPLLADWIDEVRDRFTIKRDSHPEKIDPSSDLTPLDFSRLLDWVKEPVKVQIVNPQVLLPSPSEGGVQADPTTTGTSSENDPANTKPEKRGGLSNWFKIPILALVWAGGGVATLGVIALGIAGLSKRLSRMQQHSEYGAADENFTGQEHLFAYYGEERLDLGEQAALTEITIGREIGSTILLDHEGIQNRHLRIVKKRKKLIARNCSDEPVTVNGIKLSASAKTELTLPAEVVLGGVTVSLQNETIDFDMEAQSDENA